ncbi:hypothetical protein RvY_04786 [Ramazzottius varieornatus]|uniref:Gfo/Idh/MocA-like oxidoreductase N-terminal domain-containing protein n=1 Tax=Ramazzottius varieornatus TaxID=947166 RepID=A0A1D1V1Z2_RAMVA|nr:hypothetical protein RvY_04786 [Ramazzottius varieornatus]
MLMKHNKHILCEKPMTLLLSQGKELFQIALEQLVKKELGRGAVGDLAIYRIQFSPAVLGSDMPDQTAAGAKLDNESYAVSPLKMTVARL